MESAAVVALRAFIMLACLILVPLAAIFGSAFPDVVKSVLVDRFVLSTGQSSNAENDSSGGFSQLSQGPGSAPASSDAAVSNVAPRWQGADASAATPGAAWPSAAISTSPEPFENRATPVWPSRAEMTAGASVGATRATPTAPSMNPAFAASTAVGPANPTTTAVEQASGVRPEGPLAASTSVYAASTVPAHAGEQLPPANTVGAAAAHDRTAVVPPVDRFTAIEQALRQYGAHYYRLETSGNKGELYRFQCKMLVADGSSYTRDFESTDADAVRAMAHVLEQVEAWRSGRTQ